MVVLICISLMIRDVGHLFASLQAICICFLEKCQVCLLIGFQQFDYDFLCVSSVYVCVLMQNTAWYCPTCNWYSVPFFHRHISCFILKRLYFIDFKFIDHFFLQCWTFWYQSVKVAFLTLYFFIYFSSLDVSWFSFLQSIFLIMLMLLFKISRYHIVAFQPLL